MGNMMSKRVKRRGKMSRQRLQGEPDAMVCYMYGIRFIDTIHIYIYKYTHELITNCKTNEPETKYLTLHTYIIGL